MYDYDFFVARNVPRPSKSQAEEMARKIESREEKGHLNFNTRMALLKTRWARRDRRALGAGLTRSRDQGAPDVLEECMQEAEDLYLIQEALALPKKPPGG